MPNVVQYEAKTELAPTDKGIAAAEMAGRRIGEYAHQIGQDIAQIGQIKYQHDENMEISNGASTGSLLEQNALQGWADFSADPKNKGDPDLAQKYLQQHLEPVIEEWQSHFKTEKGREFALNMADRMRVRMTARLFGDQSNLDAQHAHDNIRTSSAADAAATSQDPSQMDDRIKESDIKIEAMGGAIRDVSQRAAFVTAQQEEARRDITFSAYNGMAAAARAQVEETGDPTKSPALAKLKQLVASQHGFENLSQEQRDAIMGVGGEPGFAERAEKGGQEQFRFNQNQDKEAIKTAGNADFATLQAREEVQLRPNAPPDPTLAHDVDAYTKQYGRVLPEHSAALQSGITRLSAPEEQQRLVPEDTPTARSMIASLGTDRQPTDAQIAQAQFTHQINDHVATIIREGRKLADDPTNKLAVASLKRMQEDMAAAIRAAAPGSPQAEIAINQMRVDSQLTFNGWGADPKVGATQGVAIMRDANNKQNFIANLLPDYIAAATDNDAAAYLKGDRGYQSYRANQAGSGPALISPVAGPTQAAPAPEQPSTDVVAREARVRQILGH